MGADSHPLQPAALRGTGALVLIDFRAKLHEVILLSRTVARGGNCKTVRGHSSILGHEVAKLAGWTGDAKVTAAPWATEKTKKKTKKTSEQCSGAHNMGSTGRRRGGASTLGLATSQAGCTRQPQRPYQTRTASGVGRCQAR